MTNFYDFLPILLKHEGGFVNHPNDPGGATNKGITFQTFERYARKLLGVEPTLTNLKALTDKQAAVIYKNAYWDPIKADFYDSQKLANFTFDFYVNAGGNAIKVLQKILKTMGFSLRADGVVGPMSLQAIQDADQKKLYKQYKEARRDYYKSLAELNPKLKVFLKGWLNRVNSFPD